MDSEPTLTVEAAIGWIATRFPAARVISSCGYVTRDLFGNWDRPDNFYLVGAMGMALPVGIGVAITEPDRTVIVLEGDGSFLMNLGAVAVAGGLRPQNLVHVLLDNGMHESTGGQETVGLPDLALLLPGAGYASGSHASTPDELAATQVDAGPTYVHLRIAPRRVVGPRVTISPPDLVERFREAGRARPEPTLGSAETPSLA